MKLKMHFGLNEPARIINWWQTIKDFPPLVLYKKKKWEFAIYDTDQSKQVDYICHFSPLQTYDPNWHATTYVDIDYLFNTGYGKCECGAEYTSFPWDHMKFCPKWTKWGTWT